MLDAADARKLTEECSALKEDIANDIENAARIGHRMLYYCTHDGIGKYVVKNREYFEMRGYKIEVKPRQEGSRGKAAVYRRGMLDEVEISW